MSFWYLATPYTLYPEGKSAAFRAALEQAAILLQAGIEVYSPIVHGHPIDMRHLRIPDGDAHDFWIARNLPFMHAATGMIECRLPSWIISVGMMFEASWFAAEGKPVIAMEPGEVPNLPAVGRHRGSQTETQALFDHRLYNGG